MNLRRKVTRHLMWCSAALPALGAALVFATASPSAADPPQCSPTGPTGLATPPAVGASCQITGTATLTGGTLTVEAPSNLYWSDTLNGMDVAVNDVPGDSSGPATNGSVGATLTAIDATGTARGWNISATATQFSTGGTNPLTLSANSLGVNGSSTAEADNTAPNDTASTDSTAADDTVTPYPVSGIDGGSNPVVIYNAAAGSGMGTNALATDWWLKIPGNTYAGTYSSTITLQIASGPS
jgi:hypothetical protein